MSFPTHDGDASTGSGRPAEPGADDAAALPAEHHLVELDTEQCWSLLRTQPVGRLAWNSDRGPSVVPVNYAVTEGGIVIRTTAYSAMALELEAEESRISFQVDQIDPRTRTGWSVLARGKPRIDWSYGRVDAPEVPVWPAGPRPLRVHLSVLDISGRRLGS